MKRMNVGKMDKGSWIMGKLLLFPSLLFVFLISGMLNLSAQNQSKLPLKVRVGSYNIHHGEGLDNQLDLSRVGQVLEKMNADVLAVQELDSASRRVDGRNELGELSSQLLYYPTYGPSISFQGGKYGVGILSRERPVKVQRIPLPGKEEPRMLLVVELPNYVFACTHLSLTAADRLASVPIIERVAAGYDKPFIIAGDWNDKPNSEFIARMERSFKICTRKDQATFPANKPNECIDYIAIFRGGRVGGTVRVGSPNGELADYRAFANEVAYVAHAEVVNDTVTSDHRPVCIEAVLPTPAKKLMTTQPYLQQPTETSVEVMFQTNAVCHCWIEYGTDSLNTQKVRALLDGQEVCYDIENRISLSGLKPGVRYFYRVCASELLMKGGYENHFGDTLRTRFYSFRTQSEANRDFTCLVFNDLHENADCFKAMRALTAGIPYDFVIFNGDCLPEPNNRDHAIQMIHNLADAVDGAERPVFFIRGNHEIRNYYSAGMHSLIGYLNNKTYGAFTWGDTRFVMLDCGEDKPDSSYVFGGLNDFTQLRSEQVDFLKQELKCKAFKNAERRVLISHIPVYGNVDSYNPCHKMWGPLLDRAPFDVALGAHTHEAAFYPQGTEGCKYPVSVGDGPSAKSGTVMVLSKRGKQLNLKVLSENKKNCVDVNL